VKIGIGIPNPVPNTPGSLILDWAKRAEVAGFSGLVTIDRIAYPSYDSLTTLTAAAAATERISLMTNILLAPIYTPVLLAKTAASIDQLSQGRFSLGLAAGGRPDDYEITGPGKTLYSDHDTIYLKYVSNGASYGLNLAAWPETFAEGVGHLLAASVALPITKSRDDRDNETKEAEKTIAQAKVRDAVDERVKTKPVGRLVRSRFRYRGGTRPLNPR